MAVLVSFDIDGTLEVGDPPGPVTMDMVRKAQECGVIIGSCSDRPLPVQQGIWDKNNIEPSFVCPKQGLADLKGRIEADKYYHIGDTELDRLFALEAGFQFVKMDDGHTEPWIVDQMNGDTGSGAV